MTNQLFFVCYRRNYNDSVCNIWCVFGERCYGALYRLYPFSKVLKLN